MHQTLSLSAEEPIFYGTLNVRLCSVTSESECRIRQSKKNYTELVFYLTVYLFPRFLHRADFFNDIKFGFSLCVCSSGGLILDYAVDKYHGIAVFSPVMNGRFLAQTYGPCCARSVRHELKSNIFPSGLSTQLINSY